MACEKHRIDVSKYLIPADPAPKVTFQSTHVVPGRATTTLGIVTSNARCRKGICAHQLYLSQVAAITNEVFCYGSSWHRLTVPQTLRR